MEKLQQALQKARKQRGGPVAQHIPGGRDGYTADALWLSLQDFAPDHKHLRRNEIVTYQPGPFTAALDALRTKTVLHMQKNGWRRLAITSPSTGAGKTTLLCNLAMSLARQPDSRCILFDFDLRSPGIARLLGATSAHDVTEVIHGEVAFAEQALRIGENAAVSLATRTAQDPLRHLMSRDAEEQLAEIERRYKPDFMLFDLPQLVIGGDTPGFLQNVDCALIVASAEETTVAEIDICEREVAESTNVLGVVLNKCRYGMQNVR
jgi:protein-tyrosine kinase